MSIGVIIIDHGSRSERSNRLLIEVAQQFAARYKEFDVIEPAHMEMAEPTLKQAYARCVDRGADSIVVCPFFLAPGKHMTFDIPKLAEEAAAEFPGTKFRVAAPLGVDELIVELLAKRTTEALCDASTSRQSNRAVES